MLFDLNKVATYGTKFAADNWMHKSMGIQLGLTDSLRCNVSETEGKGIGYWKVTVYALGYKDYSTEFEITADNLPKVYGPIKAEQKTQLKTLADKAWKYLNNEATKYPDTVSKETLQAHHKEATDMLADKTKKENEAAELITELTGYLEKMDEANKSSTPPTETKHITGTISPEDDAEDGNITESYNFSFDVKLQDGTIIEIFNDTTNAGDNDTYWKKATTVGVPKKNIKGLFETLIGKSASDIDTVNAVSGATVSSNAIKKAVKNALSK